MKTQIIFKIVLPLLLISGKGLSQSVGISSSGFIPNPSAMLEIKSDTKGLLIPRTSSITRESITSPAKGLMVYDTTASAFYYFNGVNWNAIGTNDNTWGTSGNVGTNPTNNFLGTTDNSFLQVKVNNAKAGGINHLKGNTAFGFTSLSLQSGIDNTAIGMYSMANASKARNNVAIGAYALATNDSINNIAIGKDALVQSSVGKSNIAIGISAMRNNNAENNIAIGTDAMFNNTKGKNNIAIGSATLSSTTKAENNIAIGFLALNNTDSTNNIGIGLGSMFWNAKGTQNNAVGVESLNNNSNGKANNAFGYRAAYNIGGNGNVAIGSKALYGSVLGSFANNNIAIGDSSLSNVSTGSFNIGIGAFALASNTLATHNIGIGFKSLKLNTAVQNTSIGSFSMENNKLGAKNTAQGYGSLGKNNIGESNVAIGHIAMYNTDSSFNVAIGASALFSNVKGANNTAIGTLSLQKLTYGLYNTAIGRDALVNMDFGASNTALGISAGNNIVSGNQNTYLGMNANSNDALINANAIGSQAYVSQSNSLVLGSIATVNGATADVNVGIGTTAPQQRLHIKKNTAVDGGNNILLLENVAAGGAGIQFKNINANSNNWQVFLSTLGEFKIGREGLADYLTVKNGGNFGVGISPDVKLQVNGGFAVTKNTTLIANSTNFPVTVGNQSFIAVESNSTIGLNRTLVLSDGLVIGQILFIQASGNSPLNFFTLVEGTSNVDIPGSTGATLFFNGSDIIQLIWSGNDWVLLNYQDITP